VATTLLAGDATAPGMELAARYGLPVDAYRVRDHQMLPSLQWTPSPGFARWLGPRLARADLVHAHMVGAWWAAARALPPDVPLVASEHNQMCWPARDHTPQARAAGRRVGGPLTGVQPARYDAGKTVAAFMARLKDAVDLDTIQADLLGVVHRSLEPAHVSV
jgi:hypothetical protein